MKKTIFALFLACVAIFSCKKHHDDAITPTTNQPYSNSNAGTNWIYENKAQDPTTLDTTTTFDTSRVISGDTTVGSKSYFRVEHNDGSHTYYNISGNDYYQFQHLTIPAIIDTSIEALYLKDNAASGTNWNQVLSIDLGLGFPISVTLTSSISGTGLTKTVNGVTYNDVISVGTVVAAPGITINSNIQNYYARNIGLIQGDYNIDITGFGGVHTQSLIKYADPH